MTTINAPTHLITHSHYDAQALTGGNLTQDFDASLASLQNSGSQLIARGRGSAQPSPEIRAVLEAAQRDFENPVFQSGVVPREGNATELILKGFDNANGQEAKARFLTELLQESVDPNNEDLNLASFIADAFKDRSSEFGEALRYAFYSPKIWLDVKILAQLLSQNPTLEDAFVVTPRLPVAASDTLVDLIISTGNTNLANQIGQAALDMVSVDLGANFTPEQKSALFSSVARLAQFGLDQGDPSLATRVARRSFEEPNLGKIMANSLVDGLEGKSSLADEGLKALVDIMNRLDIAGGVPKDFTEHLFQSILEAGDDSQRLRNGKNGEPYNAVLGGLNTFFQRNASRLLDEATLPRAGTDNPAYAVAEGNDYEMIALFVSNVLLNPELGDAQRALSFDALSVATDAAYAKAIDTELDPETRQIAARSYGLGMGSVLEGIERNVDTATNYGSNREVIGNLVIEFIAVGLGIFVGEQTGGIAGKVLKDVTKAVLKEGSKAARVQEQLEERVSPQNGNVDSQSAGLLAFNNTVREASIGLFPDASGSNSEPLALELQESYEAGFNAPKR